MRFGIVASSKDITPYLPHLKASRFEIEDIKTDVDIWGDDPTMVSTLSAVAIIDNITDLMELWSICDHPIILSRTDSHDDINAPYKIEIYDGYRE